jgi:hypothetical protein
MSEISEVLFTILGRRKLPSPTFLTHTVTSSQRLDYIMEQRKISGYLKEFVCLSFDGCFAQVEKLGYLTFMFSLDKFKSRVKPTFYLLPDLCRIRKNRYHLYTWWLFWEAEAVVEGEIDLKEVECAQEGRYTSDEFVMRNFKYCVIPRTTLTNIVLGMYYLRESYPYVQYQPPDALLTFLHLYNKAIAEFFGINYSDVLDDAKKALGENRWVKAAFTLGERILKVGEKLI